MRSLGIATAAGPENFTVSIAVRAFTFLTMKWLRLLEQESAYCDDQVDSCFPASLASSSCLPELAPQTHDLVPELGNVMRSGHAARLVLSFLADEKAGEAGRDVAEHGHAIDR